VNKIRLVNSAKESEVNKEVIAALAPINEQIHLLQLKASAIRESFNEKYVAIRKCGVDLHACPEEKHPDLRKFDKETNKKILDYLNGITSTLIEE
jgi:hypothetical protein